MYTTPIEDQRAITKGTHPYVCSEPVEVTALIEIWKRVANLEPHPMSINAPNGKNPPTTIIASHKSKTNPTYPSEPAPTSTPYRS